jgi:hypothetical protein
MVKWTTTPEEYEHARRVILEMPYGQQVSITMKNGAILEGWIVGSSSGNDVGDNLTRGRGPIITSMYGEIRIQLQNGHVLVLPALDIQSFTLSN